MRLTVEAYRRLSRDDKARVDEWLAEQGIRNAFEIEWQPGAGTSVPVIIREYRLNAEGKKFMENDAVAWRERTQPVTRPFPEVTLR